MVGRYVRLEIDGTPHRIYFEEAGSGPERPVPIGLGRDPRGALEEGAERRDEGVAVEGVELQDPPARRPGVRPGHGRSS